MTRRTLAQPVTLEGQAVRTHGGPVNLTLAPGEHGFVFTRTDTGQRLPADLAHLAPAPNCTALGDGRPAVFFVEHVLSALAGLGYTDAEVTVDGPEVPLFDGSARPLVEALAAAGSAGLSGTVEPLRLTAPVRYEHQGQVLEAFPAESWAVDYTFEHAHPMIAFDQVAATLDDYATSLAPARTFATVQEIQALQAAGLIRGGSEDNLLLIYDDHLSSPLRLDHEFARHKVLDLIGDLALLGRPLLAQLVARRTGHSDNHAFARLLQDTL